MQVKCSAPGKNNVDYHKGPQYEGLTCFFVSVLPVQNGQRSILSRYVGIFSLYRHILNVVCPFPISTGSSLPTVEAMT